MARTVYTAQLLAADMVSGPTYAGTWDDTKLGVVRDISGQFVTTDPMGAALYVMLGSLTIARWYLPGGVDQIVHWEGRCAAPGPSNVTAQILGGFASCTLVVTGYLLALP